MYELHAIRNRISFPPLTGEVVPDRNQVRLTTGIG
jgi:hypothetical protein